MAVFVTMAEDRLRRASGDGTALRSFPTPHDSVNLGPSAGTFTYDSSVIPASGGMVIDDSGRLASEILAFEWGSTSWTEANAGVIVLDFDRSGGLRHFRMGGAPNGLNAVHLIPEIVDDFWLTSPYIAYTLLGQAEQEWFLGQVTSPDLAPVPEPGTLLLVSVGGVPLPRQEKRRQGLGSQTRRSCMSVTRRSVAGIDVT